MAALFKKAGQADSSLHYARLSFVYANEVGFPKRILYASSFLSDYYKNLKHCDSAWYYQGITIAAKDSLFSQEKTREIQNLRFEETIRQTQIKEENANYEAKRRNYISPGLHG